jgi:hypothetical protein
VSGTGACPRSWEIEAIEDGRLTEVDRSSFERHLAACARCRDEVAQVEAARAVMQHAPLPEWSALDRQRVRNQLLRRANEAFVSGAPTSPRRVALAALVAVALVAGGASYASLREAGRTGDVASSDAAPAREIERDHVASRHPRPDVPTASEPSLDPVALNAAPLLHPRAANVDASAPAPVPATHASASGARFKAAMASFEAGEYFRADSELEQFAREFPEDPRCEDAAYLRAVARFRRGDKAGAAALARAYLSMYPAGLRRIEARRLADASVPPPK